MLTALLDILIAGQYRKVIAPEGKRLPPSYIIQQSRILESASRRYLAAIRELARVRKLQANTAAVQFNTQINLGR